MNTWQKAWAILDREEKRKAPLVLFVVLMAALLSAGMVASIVPFLSVLSDPSKIQSELTLRWAYDYFGFTSTYSYLIALGCGSLAVIGVSSLIQIFRVYILSRYSMMIMHSLACRLLQTYLRQPYVYFLENHSSELGTQILSESQQVVNQFFKPAANVVAGLFTVCTVLSLLFWINPTVTFVSFSFLGTVYGVTFLFSRGFLMRLGQSRLRANKGRYRIATEALGGVKEIKLLGLEASYLKRFEQPSKEMAWKLILATVIGEVPSYVLQACALGGVIVLGLVMINPAAIDDGSALGGMVPLLGVFAFAGQRLIPELQRLYLGVTQIQFGRTAVDAIYDDINSLGKGEPFQETAVTALGLTQQIELKEICHRYSKADRNGLDHINLRIAAGEKIGVVGSTGAGKSTMADLLLGLIHPSSGTFNVDGQEITKDTLRSWQRTVGYVPQSIFLIDATIKENIRLGLEADEVNLDRVKEVCRIAQLANFIETDLPLKYDTIVGERGVRLSGGQRQRIGIARALYYDADLIVFDEATSALDNTTEAEVMTAIDALPAHKTVLMIAHRLGTVQRCDRIVVLDRGRIVGVDTWESLLASNPIFQKFAHVAKAE